MYNLLLRWGIDYRRMDIELELLLIQLSRISFKKRVSNSSPLVVIRLSLCLYFPSPILWGQSLTSAVVYGPQSVPHTQSKHPPKRRNRKTPKNDVRNDRGVLEIMHPR